METFGLIAHRVHLHNSKTQNVKRDIANSISTFRRLGKVSIQTQKRLGIQAQTLRQNPSDQARGTYGSSIRYFVRYYTDEYPAPKMMHRVHLWDQLLAPAAQDPAQFQLLVRECREEIERLETVIKLLESFHGPLKTSKSVQKEPPKGGADG